MNNKTLVIVFLICGLILSALILRDGKPLLLAMPFLVYLIIGVIQTPSNMTLTADRIINQPSVIAQEAFETRIIIKNQGNGLVNLSQRYAFPFDDPA